MVKRPLHKPIDKLVCEGEIIGSNPVANTKFSSVIVIRDLTKKFSGQFKASLFLLAQKRASLNCR